jgi:hypothetical protein
MMNEKSQQKNLFWKYVYFKWVNVSIINYFYSQWNKETCETMD